VVCSLFEEDLMCWEELVWGGAWLGRSIIERGLMSGGANERRYFGFGGRSLFEKRAYVGRGLGGEDFGGVWWGSVVWKM